MDKTILQMIQCDLIEVEGLVALVVEMKEGEVEEEDPNQVVVDARHHEEPSQEVAASRIQVVGAFRQGIRVQVALGVCLMVEVALAASGESQVVLEEEAAFPLVVGPVEEACILPSYLVEEEQE